MKRKLRILSLILGIATILAICPFAVATTQTTNPYFVFNNARSMAYLTEPNNTSVAFSVSDRAAVLTTAADACDPYVFLDADERENLSADEYKYMVITYKLPASSTNLCQFFLCAGAVESATADCVVDHTLTRSTSFVSDIIDLSKVAQWNGTIHGVRFDYFNNCLKAENLTLAAISFAKTADEASKVASERTAAANGAVEETVLTYDFKSSTDVGRFSVEGGEFMPGDLNGDGKIRIVDSLLLKKHIGGHDVDVNAEAGDVNGDGRVNTLDIRALKKYLAGNEAEYAKSGAEVSFDGEKMAAKLKANSSSPAVTLTFDDAVLTDSHSFVVLTYMIDKTECAPLVINFSNGCTETVELVGDGIFHSVKLSYIADLNWKESVGSAEFILPLEAEEECFIDSVIFTETIGRANREAAFREQGVSETSYDRIIFDSEDSLSFVEAAYSTSITFDEGEQAALYTVAGTAGDPRSVIDYTASGLSADDYKYIIITYKIPTSTGASGESELFLCAGDVTEPTADYRKTFNPIKDGTYHYEIIPLTDAEYWIGPINQIRFDYFTVCASGDTMLVDSVCLAKTKAESIALGKERLADKNGESDDEVCIEGSVVVNGEETAVSYYDASDLSEDGSVTFSGAVTMVLEDVESDFNRFSFGFTSDAIIRGIAYYTVDGVEQADEFFLENTAGTEKEFTSLITKYFDDKKASSITMIEFYTINTPSATIKLSSIEKEVYEFFEQGTYFLENELYRLGVDLLMGGGVNYLEYFDDGNPAYGNLLNNYDVGRLIQQSYYGIDGPPYEMGYWTDRAWGYNPVQGGDAKNNISRIVDFEFISDTQIYVKARPMDWGQINKATPSYMENIYTIENDYVHVYNRFVDFSGYTHTPGWQELPAFYTISALNNFSYYNGNSPWTNDTLITRSDLIFWGQTSNQAFELSSTSEFWSAWTDDSGFGVGLYVPNVYTYHAGKFMYDGSPEPGAASTNYVAPRRYITLVSGKPLEYSYIFKAGSLQEIRDSFMEHRNVVDNTSLDTYNK